MPQRSVLRHSTISRRSRIICWAEDNGTVDITRSLIRNNNIGVYATRGGVTLVSDSIVENNSTGLLAFKDGMINATGLTPDGSAAPGATVRNNVNGGVARPAVRSSCQTRA